MSRTEDKGRKHSMLRQSVEIPHKEEEAGNIIIDDCTSDYMLYMLISQVDICRYIRERKLLD